ncbi:MAG: glycosyltransferase family 2 protein, partial [Saprospiraceae bacterium]
MKSIYSAVIIAKNESRTIGQCIEAVAKVTNDIIIVLDDRSTDDTHDIALSKGAKVFAKSWEGYSANKNFGVQKAKNDWIICVDADEILDETIIQDLHDLNPDIDSVYEMNIRTWFGDYPVKYCGWFPDWNIRLFNKRVMKWDHHFVHEKLISTHPLKKVRLNGLIDHFSFSDVDHMISKFDSYARL